MLWEISRGCNRRNEADIRCHEAVHSKRKRKGKRASWEYVQGKCKKDGQLYKGWKKYLRNDPERGYKKRPCSNGSQRINGTHSCLSDSRFRRNHACRSNNPC